MEIYTVVQYSYRYRNFFKILQWNSFWWRYFL